MIISKLTLAGLRNTIRTSEVLITIKRFIAVLFLLIVPVLISGCKVVNEDDANHDSQVKLTRMEKYNAKLHQQKYITIKQIKHLFKLNNDVQGGDSPSDKYGDKAYRIIQTYQDTNVVDDQTGFVYKVSIKSDAFKDIDDWKLTQVMNGKTSYIDKNWQKEHKGSA